MNARLQNADPWEVYHAPDAPDEVVVLRQEFSASQRKVFRTGLTVFCVLMFCLLLFAGSAFFKGMSATTLFAFGLFALCGLIGMVIHLFTFLQHIKLRASVLEQIRKLQAEG